MTPKERQNLLSWAQDLGISLSSSQTDTIEIYLSELWIWNKKTNLTGLTRLKDIIRELVLDSMLPSLFLPDQGRLLDVGSGAGIPAIPLLICKPKWTVTLLEPRTRRADFLRHILRRTKYHQAHVINKKIEKSSDFLHIDGYHAITARALASLKQVIEWCAPHLLPGALLINFQGSNFDEALEQASEAADRHDLVLHKTVPYQLPGKSLPRNILIFQKKIS